MNLEFDKELHSLNESKLPISASKIQSITKLALKHVKVLHILLDFFSNVDSLSRMLYLV